MVTAPIPEPVAPADEQPTTAQKNAPEIAEAAPVEPEITSSPRWWRRRAVLLGSSALAVLLVVAGVLVGVQQALGQAHEQAMGAAHHAAAIQAQRAAAARALQAKQAAQKAAAVAAAAAAAKAQDAADKTSWDQKAQADANAFAAAAEATGDGEVTGFPSDDAPEWSTIDDLYSCTVAHCVVTGLVAAGETITQFFLGDPASHSRNVTTIQTRIHVQAG